MQYSSEDHGLKSKRPDVPTPHPNPPYRRPRRAANQLSPRARAGGRAGEGVGGRGGGDEAVAEAVAGWSAGGSGGGSRSSGAGVTSTLRTGVGGSGEVKNSLSRFTKLAATSPITPANGMPNSAPQIPITCAP